MAKYKASRTRTNNAAKGLQNSANNIKNIQAANNAIANSRKKQSASLSSGSIRRMFDLFSAKSADKTRMLKKITSALPTRLLNLTKKYAIKSVGKILGFDDDKKFIEYMQRKLLATAARDKTPKEFSEGAIGRQNDFLGGIFELSVKYGPLRKIIISIADSALEVANKEINAARKTGGMSMYSADGKKVIIKEPFSKLLTANRIDIGTPDGARESLDFGSLGFNSQGHCFFPLPVEIKLPRAASGVGKQFASFPERLAEAIKSKNKVFMYFSEDEFERFKKSRGFDKFFSGHKILGPQEMDGRKMVKVEISPEKLVFNNDSENPMAHNRMLVRPDSRFWNPADPAKIPQVNPKKQFEIEVSAADIGSGFNFWRMLVPVERSLFIDIYKSIFD